MNKIDTIVEMDKIVKIDKSDEIDMTDKSDKIVFFQFAKTVGWAVAQFELRRDFTSLLWAAVNKGAHSPILIQFWYSSLISKLKILSQKQNFVLLLDIKPKTFQIDD